MTINESVRTGVDLSQLALDIAGQPSPAEMICRVAQLAAELVDRAAADLVRITGSGQLRVIASSDPGLSELTEKAWQQWPHTTITQGSAADDEAMTEQRNTYRQQIRRDAGVVQELILPLVAGQNDHGYLRFLVSGSVAGLAERALMTAFCAHAEIALDRAALLTQVQNLQVALESNREIGAAVGVLMARDQLSYADGLSRLKTVSQNSNRKLREVAAGVLYTGALPAS